MTEAGTEIINRWVDGEREPDRGVRLLTIPEVARRLALGEAKTWEMVADGTLESVKIDRARRVPDTAVDAYIAKLRAGA